MIETVKRGHIGNARFALYSNQHPVNYTCKTVALFEHQRSESEPATDQVCGKHFSELWSFIPGELRQQVLQSINNFPQVRNFIYLIECYYLFLR